jgi:hypothetical protein
MRKRALTLFAVAVLAGAFTAVALAAQPKSEGFYGGAFKNGKNYVSFLVTKSDKIATADVQYRCKGKSVIAHTGQKFKPRPLSSTGAFELEFKARITSNDGKGRKVGSGRVRIVGRFVTSSRAEGTARVKSEKCPKRKQAFVANGPQIEG